MRKTEGKRFILSIDQGTTRTKAVLFDARGQVVGLGYSPVPRTFPRPGWVEQDPELIWQSVLTATRKAMKEGSCSPKQIAAVGIADQGETVVMWKKRTGKPLYNAIVRQCRRTTSQCEGLKKEGYESEIRKKTGLVLDPYFSATKVRWILENVPKVEELAQSGDALFGTTDTWLVWKMSRGRYFVTDYATASRTMLFNIHEMHWDPDLLQIFGVPDKILAETRPNSGIVGYTDPDIFLGIEAPISGLIVDQQAALFGHGCFRDGDPKNTYGTGCFFLMNTGPSPKTSNHNLLTTIAWVINGQRNYALDGGVYVAGSAIDWLIRGLKLVRTPEETDRIARSVLDNGGVFFVPAFVGLAAPYWDSQARGTMVGITDGTTSAHIVRATLESIAYQVDEVLNCMEADSNLKVETLRVDGGPTSNRFLMQFQSDISGIPIEVPLMSEVTAQGAAFLAGMGVDFWESPDDLIQKRKKMVYKPQMPQETRERLRLEWKRAVQRAMRWVTS